MLSFLPEDSFPESAAPLWGFLLEDWELGLLGVPWEAGPPVGGLETDGFRRGALRLFAEPLEAGRLSSFLGAFCRWDVSSVISFVRQRLCKEWV